jgi:uracil-DNA glycosylase
MPMTLRQALEETLAGWKEDILPQWQAVLAGTEPAFQDVDDRLQHEPWEPIFPTRRGKTIPGAPPDAHIFRALDGISPEQVRAVVIGQDPYPNVSWATGRAFEQGDLLIWPENGGFGRNRLVSASLENILRVWAVAKTGDRRFVENPKGWQEVVREAEALKLPSPRKLFDSWQKQGVLFLNAGLTLSRYESGGAEHQIKGHIPLWRPVIGALLTHLATRPEGHVVFMLWGRPAENVFVESGAKAAAETAGTWETRVRTVRHTHPVARVNNWPSFFRDPNPLLDTNAALLQMGEEPINW